MSCVIRRRRHTSYAPPTTMGAEDDIKGILGVASQVCFCGTLVATMREAYGHWLYHACSLCGGAKTMRCKNCDATGKLKKPASGDWNDVRSDASGTFACMFCSGSGAVKCSKCLGAGGEIAKKLNWTRMAEGSKPFKDLARNRTFGVVPSDLDVGIVRRTEKDILEDFALEHRVEVDAVVARARRKRDKRRARAAARASSGGASSRTGADAPSP